MTLDNMEGYQNVTLKPNLKKALPNLGDQAMLTSGEIDVNSLSTRLFNFYLLICYIKSTIL